MYGSIIVDARTLCMRVNGDTESGGESGTEVELTYSKGRSNIKTCLESDVSANVLPQKEEK